MATEQLLLQVFALFVAAKLLGRLSVRLGAPEVVGEILAGVVLGLAVFRGPLQFGADPVALDFVAEIGVVFLLFSVGLQTPLHQLTRVGRTAMAVAAAGVVTPLVAGYAFGVWVMGQATPEALFLGTSLVATSVGITAKVLGDRGMLDTTVARVILGAAIIDDVLGLLVLALAKSLAIGGVFHLADLAVVAALAGAFVAAAVLLTPRVVRAAVRRADKRHPAEAFDRARTEVVVFAIGLCLGLSVLAAVLGLAALVGAFLAGMALAEFRERYHLEEAFRPLVLFTAPLFFAVLGLRIDLGAAQGALVLVVVLTAVALVTKLVPCALAARRMGRWNALVVGAGMAPRGEVGLIVASIGLQAGVVSAPTYAIVVAMALLTTLLGPPMLDLTLRQAAKHAEGRGNPPGPTPAGHE